MAFRDPLNVAYSPVFAALHQDPAGQWVGAFQDLALYSAFQPIYSLAHRRAVGFEGLVRAVAPDGRSVFPGELFALPQGQDEMVFLDRLCRAVHCFNFQSHFSEPAWLFLNVNARVIAAGRSQGSFLSGLMEASGVPPQRMVVEILEDAVDDKALLDDAVGYYKAAGCLVAIDDFGAGHSNIDRIWRVEPHIVKLDRSITAQAAASSRIRRALPNLVNLIHEAGSLVLMEGIETRDEALIGMDSDVDFVQGYYFRRPQTLPFDPASAQDFALLDREFGEWQGAGEVGRRRLLSPYVSGFEKVAGFLHSGLSFEDACARFLRQPHATCCYLLDQEGNEMGDNVFAEGFRQDPRFAPVVAAAGANWRRRGYFRQAVGPGDSVVITRPYLSVATGRECVTLAKTLALADRKLVLCGDLDWGGLESEAVQ